MLFVIHIRFVVAYYLCKTGEPSIEKCSLSIMPSCGDTSMGGIGTQVNGHLEQQPQYYKDHIEASKPPENDIPGSSCFSDPQGKRKGSLDDAKQSFNEKQIKRDDESDENNDNPDERKFEVFEAEHLYAETECICHGEAIYQENSKHDVGCDNGDHREEEVLLHNEVRMDQACRDESIDNQVVEQDQLKDGLCKSKEHIELIAEKDTDLEIESMAGKRQQAKHGTVHLEKDNYILDTTRDEVQLEKQSGDSPTTNGLAANDGNNKSASRNYSCGKDATKTDEDEKIEACEKVDLPILQNLESEETNSLEEEVKPNDQQEQIDTNNRRKVHFEKVTSEETLEDNSHYGDARGIILLEPCLCS